MWNLWVLRKGCRSRLTPEEISEGYRVLPQFQISEEYYKNFAMRAGPMPGRILDIGCGFGEVLEELRKLNPTSEFDGVDISDKALAHLPAFIHGRLGAAERLPYDTCAFDYVVMSGVIEHCLGIPQALREVRRVLKPGGRLYLSTDSLAWHVHMNLKNIFIFWKKPHYHRFKQPIDYEFTRWSLARYLKRAGFKILHFQHSGPYPFASNLLARFPFTRGITKRIEVLCQRTDR